MIKMAPYTERERYYRPCIDCGEDCEIFTDKGITGIYVRCVACLKKVDE